MASRVSRDNVAGFLKVVRWGIFFQAKKKRKGKKKKSEIPICDVYGNVTRPWCLVFSKM